MKGFPHAERLAAFGLAGSALVLIAGFVATISALGVVIASSLLTLAAIVLALGIGAARDRPSRLHIGILAPVAAALPTFGIFYAIGLFIFEHLGQAAGGGLLIAIGALLAVASGVTLLRGQRPARQ